jgi:phosphoserine phosphatase
VPGARELVATLAAEGREVHVVSGGLRQAVLPLAADLGIGSGHVHAVPVRLDNGGLYAGWDHAAPTARSGGKAEVVRRLAGGSRAVLVGDGVTDLEARTAGALVIGFGGVALRERVRAEADAFVAGRSLSPVLAIIHAWESVEAP